MARRERTNGQVKRVGIVGYGNLGKYLADCIQRDGERYNVELAFVWNRNFAKLANFEPKSSILHNLNDFAAFEPNLIVEVSHPDISKEYGTKFLQYCDYVIGSPSALADEHLEAKLRRAANKFGLFVPKGALWGAEDIRALARRGQLKGLNVEMRFHPRSLKLVEPLKTKNESVKDEPLLLYKGSVRNICKLAPNNVNTMACAAIAGESLGFDGTIGTLISDPNLTFYHKITIEVLGPIAESGCQFKVTTERRSPSFPGHLTSTATYNSFLNSLL
ncbi:putative L-aspartate dehydrogenase-like protein, partial [Dinothrombium tinctorium]